ncbi:MAG TPA: lipid A biosynthesis acyltransferase [Myxococcales bacterium]|nr:lipid A biosynthesis acyltransferase [Myxococcales bacterium]
MSPGSPRIAAPPAPRPAPLGKRMRRELRVRALLVLLPLLSRLPRRVGLALGAAAGWLAWLMAQRHRRAALEHLALAFPDRDRRWRSQVGRSSFVNLGRSALEILAADFDLSRDVQFDPGSLETLTAAHAEGRGVVAFSCHVDNWELLARRVAAAGLPLATVAREAQDPRLTALLEKSRGGAGIVSLWRNQSGAARAFIRHLRSGWVVAALVDQDTGVAGHFVPFFQREAFTPRAPADLALRLGAPAVFARIRRVAPGMHRIRVSRLAVPASGDAEADSLALTAAATEAIEEEVREHPDQWVWMHPRWRTRPGSIR